MLERIHDEAPALGEICNVALSDAAWNIGINSDLNDIGFFGHNAAALIREPQLDGSSIVSEQNKADVLLCALHRTVNANHVSTRWI